MDGKPVMGSNHEENLVTGRKHYRYFRFCFPACIGCTILAGINPAAQPTKCCCRDCRGSRQRLPRYDLADVVVLLDLGADGYITKPYSPGELLARVRTAMRPLIY
jgi:hypothetical protein